MPSRGRMVGKYRGGLPCNNRTDKKMEKIIDIARAEIGTKESPPGSNRTKYGEWFGLNGQSWCGIFVSWCYAQAGLPLGIIDFLKGYASCPYAVANVHKWGKIIDKKDALPGDIVFYAWTKPGHYDHTGLFVKDIGNNMFEAVEGNTGLGNDSNGGEVMLRQRRYSVATFVRANVIK